MAQTGEVSRLIKHDRVGILEIDSPPVNALGVAVRVALDTGVRALLADPEVEAVVVACGGRTFFAGADISEFGKPLQGPGLNQIFALIEGASKPVVAAIHGTALGGGLELALACHYRIAVRSAKVGLPEVSLGLLPGAGGTQRTPRLAGVSKALELIVHGKPIDASAAQGCGLIDEIAPEGSLRDAAVAYARGLVDAKAPLRRARDLSTDVSGEAAAQLFADFRRTNAPLFRGFKAPENIVKAIEAAVALPFDEGIAREFELFRELEPGRESEAQRYIFFAERAATKIPGLSSEVKPIRIGSVAVIGAGTMGTGISTAFLNAGLPVTMIDLDAAALERGAATIAKTLRGAAQKGRISADEAELRVGLLKTAGGIEATGAADLIIEAVFERLDLKMKVFREMDAAAKPDAILASNTSFLDLDAIAAVTSRPERVIGLHFFSPAHIMRLLEVVRGAKTSDAILTTGMGLGRRLGKVAVMSAVCDGFIANRLMARRSEAADRILLEGIMPWDVDRAMTEFGFPMGPFAMIDLVGVDVIGWDRENSAGRTVQEVLCENGRWGQKRSGGYYDYDEQRRRTPSPYVEEVIRAFAAKHGVSRKGYTDQAIIEHLLDPVVNEGAKLIEEGVVLRASDIDVALVTGYAWPSYTGGPMFWGDTVGLDKIVARLKAREASEPITVSPLLERLAKEGGSLASL